MEISHSGGLGWKAVGAALAILLYWCGHVTGYREALKPKDVASCDSSDTLSGSTWRIDLNKDLFDQDCAVADDGTLLCDRVVTIECDTP